MRPQSQLCNGMAMKAAHVIPKASEKAAIDILNSRVFAFPCNKKSNKKSSWLREEKWSMETHRGENLMKGVDIRKATKDALIGNKAEEDPNATYKWHDNLRQEDNKIHSLFKSTKRRSQYLKNSQNPCGLEMK